jgi:hypothetical protein
MAHFAEIDENSIVTRVLVVDNSLEHRGQDFLANDVGLGGTWVQTSYNKNFRGNFAGIGDLYDEEFDVFYRPQPYTSWTLDQTTWTWNSPVPYPEDGSPYDWNEESQEWVQAIE